MRKKEEGKRDKEGTDDKSRRHALTTITSHPHDLDDIILNSSYNFIQFQSSITRSKS